MVSLLPGRSFKACVLDAMRRQIATTHNLAKEDLDVGSIETEGQQAFPNDSALPRSH